MPNKIPPKPTKTLIEITNNNRWYGIFLWCVKTFYCKEAWRELIADCNSDIRLFGYDYVKKKWAKFIDTHTQGQLDNLLWRRPQPTTPMPSLSSFLSPGLPPYPGTDQADGNYLTGYRKELG